MVPRDQTISGDVRQVRLTNTYQSVISLILKSDATPFEITYIRHHGKHLVIARLKGDGVFSILTKDIETVINTEAA